MIKTCLATYPISGNKEESSYLQRGVRGKAKKDLNQDEAATIIQKQIRGSLARKQYGPMVKAATGKLDEDTVIFMKTWCKKWRIKSIFQVLLLYRATKHRDLVYFSQQVHLYNQNVLSELQYFNDAVDLKEVDPHTKISYLPIHRPAVHKLPFRFGDLSYFDSSYICDSSRDLSNLKPKGYEETWDSPLQRNIGDKYRHSAGLRNFREQGCQTYMDDKEYTVYSGAGGYSLPETPFVREKAIGVKLPILGEEKRHDFGGKMGSSRINQGVKRKSMKSAAPKNPKGLKEGPPTYGPIHEMSEKFRQNSADEDNPPFNFQAMLRKTNNKRESLKRADNEFTSPARKYNNNKTSDYGDNNNKTTDYGGNNNIVFQSKEYNAKKPSNYDNTNGNFSKTGKQDSLELAPGVVIHGEVADL